VERLQDRIAPAAYAVINLDDSGAGSLRQAVLDSNATAAVDQISFSAPALNGTIALTSGPIIIADHVTITGPGAAQLTISGNNAGRVFQVNSGIAASIIGLTITGGKSASEAGGAIHNSGDLSISDCNFMGNTSGSAGGAIAATAGSLTVDRCIFTNNSAASGGAIAVSAGTASISRSTFHGNSTTSGPGAALANASKTTISNSTISANRSSGGGAIANTAGDLAIIASTIVGNSSSASAGILVAGGNVALLSDIVVGNSAPNDPGFADIDGSVDTENSRFNLVGMGTGGLTNGTNNNKTGLSASDVPFSDLGNYGGSTPTLAILPASPALNAGSAVLTTLASGTTTPADVFLIVDDPTFLGVDQVIAIDGEQLQITGVSGTTLTVARGVNGTTAVNHVAGAIVTLPTDQRGFARSAGGQADVGAFETQPSTLAIATLSLPDATVNQGYNQTIAAAGATAPIAFTLSGGSLPVGLTLNTTTGVFSGTPSIVGSSIFRVTAVDAAGATATQQYQVRVVLDVPVIVGLSPASGSTLALPLTSIDVNFNKPVAPDSVNPGDLVLSQGFATGFTLLDNNRTIRFALSGITAEGVLNVSLPAGVVADLGGNLNLAFSGSYALDFGNVAFPPLTAVAPRGSLVYASESSPRAIAPDSDTDTFTINLDAGQRIIAALEPASGLQGSLQLFSPTSVLIKSANATAPGQPIAIDSVLAPVSGTYTIVVAGLAGTTGDYVVRVALNAHDEAEASGTSGNNALATAENIDANFLPLGPVASRGAALGRTDRITYSAAAASPSFQDISATGQRSTAAIGDDAVDTLSAAQLAGFSFPLFGKNYTSLSFSTNGLMSFVSPDEEHLNTDLSAAPEEPVLAVLWDDLEIDNTGVGAASRNVYWQVVGSGPSAQLNIQWNNAHRVDETGTFTFQAILSADGGIQLNYLSGVDAAVVGSATVGAKEAGTESPQTILVDFNGSQPLGPLVGPNLSVRLTPSTPTADYYSFTVSAGASVTLAATALNAGSLALDLRDALDAPLAIGAAGAHNVSKIISNYSAAPATYYVRVAGESDVSYSLVVTKNAAFDTEPNNTIATAQSVAGTRGVLGAIEAVAGGYSAASVPFAFEDIRATGTAIAALAQADDASESVPIGFAFPFYGSAETSVFVSSNGLLSFDVANAGVDNSSLADDPQEAVIAAFWDDLVVPGAAQANVYFQTLGSGASQRLVIQWNDVSFFDDDAESGGLTFQAVLGIDGSIRLNYQSLTTGRNSGSADEGASASVGIKDAGPQGVNRLLLANPGPNALVGTGKSTLITRGSDEDWYTVTLGPTVTALRLDSQTPGDGTSQPLNALNPRIDLYDAGNVLIASGTPGADGRNESLLFSGNVPGATYRIRVIGEADSAGDYFIGITPVGPPQVVSVTPNANIPSLAGVQRSRVASLAVVFDQPVQLDADAMTLALSTNEVVFDGVQQPTGFGTLPSALNFATADNITWIVTFAGNTDNGADGFNSLKDGVYTLTVAGSKVHPLGVPSFSMSGNSATTFHRLFGDINAPSTPPGGTAGLDFSAIVNTGDNLTFRGAFNNAATYRAFLDFNGDGVINTGDNLQFRNRFNKALSWQA
jgi:predicted outer membrane repeat protein